MAIVTMLTFVLFLTSSLLLPYVPTVLASALVLFLGMELLLEAVWESAQTLVLLEWGVVMATLLACTFLGFAEGFGVGIGAAAVVYLVYGLVDSVGVSEPFYAIPRVLTSDTASSCYAMGRME
jgi:MFS superfamily sulfate permease-like transporter